MPIMDKIREKLKDKLWQLELWRFGGWRLKTIDKLKNMSNEEIRLMIKKLRI